MAAAYKSYRDDDAFSVTTNPFTLSKLRGSSPGPICQGLRIGHLNVNSLRGKVDDVVKLLKHHGFDILAITEAKLTPNQATRKSLSELRSMVVPDNDIRIEGYRFERLDRSVKNQEKQGGGGIVIYVRHGVDYSSSVRKYTEKDHDAPLQYIHIEITRPVPVNVFAVYIPPQSDAKDIRDKLLNDHCDLQNVVMLGDFNIDLKRETDNTFVGQFHQLIENYTRIHKGDYTKTETRIDHIYTNAQPKILESGVVRIGRKRISDHDLIYCTVHRSSPAHRRVDHQYGDGPLVEYFNQSCTIRDRMERWIDANDKIYDVPGGGDFFVKQQPPSSQRHYSTSYASMRSTSPTPSVSSSGAGSRWTTAEEKLVKAFAKKTGGRAAKQEVEMFIESSGLDRSFAAVRSKIYSYNYNCEDESIDYLPPQRASQRHLSTSHASVRSSSSTPSIHSDGAGSRWTAAEEKLVKAFAKKTGGRAAKQEVEMFIESSGIYRTFAAVRSKIYSYN